MVPSISFSGRECRHAHKIFAFPARTEFSVTTGSLPKISSNLGISLSRIRYILWPTVNVRLTFTGRTGGNDYAACEIRQRPSDHFPLLVEKRTTTWPGSHSGS